jgi:APA family basic amino acid/polyamine antiporter
MARNNMFLKVLDRIHPKYATPHTSLVAQGIWSCVLVLSGTFDTITDYVMFASWLFYMLGAFGVIILRKKMPDSPRPYKVWGYPYTPIIFVAFSFLFLVNTIISDISSAAMGALLILLGLPFYYWRIAKNKSFKEN